MNRTDISNLRIAVIGGGFGGAAATVFLNHLGADVHLYEQAKEIKEVGAGIGMRPKTLEVFRKWGILAEMNNVSSASEFFEILDGYGKPVVRETWPKMDEFDFDARTRMIHRGDFIDTFIRNVPTERFHLGHKMTEIVDHGDSSTVTFANGESTTVDLVIGADGIRSKVRDQLFGDYHPVFAGAHAHRVIVDGSKTHGMLTDDNLRMYVGANGTLIYFLPLRHRGPNGQLSFDITCNSDDDSWAPTLTREILAEAVEGFDERLQAITAELDLETVNSRGVYDIDQVETWHSDSVVLIGDAAHAMLHHQGQGANQTIQDSSELADCLVEFDTIPEALAAYTQRRKPDTQALQAISRQNWPTIEDLSTAFPEKGNIA